MKRFTYDYPRMLNTTDCVVFGVDIEEKKLKLLLIQRAEDPFKDYWALPGGHVEMDEDLEDAARRELKEETGIEGMFLEQLYTFGTPLRDPRGRVVTVAYLALVNLKDYKVIPNTDAKAADWFEVSNLPNLAFDHHIIIEKGIERLATKIKWQPVGFDLLPEKFTLRQLQNLYEAVTNEKLNTDSFRRKLKTILVECGKQIGTTHRPAALYKFDRRKYQKMMKEGFNFRV